MSEGSERIGLQEAIAALRKELVDSITASQAERLRFEVGEIKMEFHVEVERSAEIKGSIKGGIRFWVVDIGAAELGAGGGFKNKTIHKVTIPLKPVQYDRTVRNDGTVRYEGRPVLTGSDEIPE